MTESKKAAKATRRDVSGAAVISESERPGEREENDETGLTAGRELRMNDSDTFDEKDGIDERAELRHPSAGDERSAA